MLFIFRKLRKSFFLPGKARTYLAYALGEIFLIVGGILIAVEIGDRNQASKNRAEETEILLELKVEIERNKKDLENMTERYRKVSLNMTAFLEIIEPEPQNYPESQIFGYLASQRTSRPYNPGIAVISSLINSGKIGLINNIQLSYKLNEWSKSVTNIERVMQNMDSSMASFPIEYELYRTKDVGLGTSGVGSNTGSSHFPFDQKKLLSSPATEDMAETKLEWSEMLTILFERTTEFQQSTLDLIDAELAERGMAANP